MALECDTVLKGIVIALALAYLAFQLRNRRWSAVVAFAVIMLATCCGSHLNVVPCSNLCVCLLLAIIGSNVVALPTTVSNHSAAETFANHEDSDSKPSDKDDVSTTKKSTKKSRRDSDEEDSDEESDSEESTTTTKDESHTPHTPHKSAHKKTKSSKNAKKTDDDDDHVDSFSTFMETYRSLSPDQVESMTTDTKDLISTQKALMETVQNLAPVISQGKEMMDTFKDYFGTNGTSDMLKAFNTKNAA